jgi:hypothetical protein
MQYVGFKCSSTPTRRAQRSLRPDGAELEEPGIRDRPRSTGCAPCHGYLNSRSQYGGSSSPAWSWPCGWCPGGHWRCGHGGHARRRPGATLQEPRFFLDSARPTHRTAEAPRRPGDLSPSGVKRRQNGYGSLSGCQAVRLSASQLVHIARVGVRVSYTAIKSYGYSDFWVVRQCITA